MPTIPQIINIAKVSQYLYSKREAHGALFNNGNLDTQKQFLIYRVRKSVEYYYDRSPNYPGLLAVALYLYGLCDLSAQAIITDNGGEVTPVNPVPMPSKIEFIVDGTTPIPTGNDILSIPQFRSFNVIFSRGGTVQTSVTTEPSYYLWNNITGIFTCFPVAFAGELFSINPV